MNTDEALVFEDYQKAIKYAHQALEVARKKQNHILQLRALNILGIAYSVLGNYQDAILYAQQGLAIAQKWQEREFKREAQVTTSDT